MREITEDPVRVDPAPPNPGLTTCDPAAPGGCAICGDEALPARVLHVRSAAGLASVVMLATGMSNDAALRGQGLDVALDLVDGIGAGDTVLVHQGFIITRVEVA